MKRKYGVLLLAMVMTAALTGCGGSMGNTENAVTESADVDTAESNSTEVAESTDLSALGYTTVTEGFDWGPAITKVVLNVGMTMDSSTLTTNTFTVSSVREYTASDYITMTENEEPTVTVV